MMNLIKSYLISYVPFTAIALPWVTFTAWKNREILGGFNEPFEGFTLYMFFSVPTVLVFIVLARLASRFEGAILDRQYLILLSLISGAAIFHIRIVYAGYPFLLELVIIVLTISIFLLAKKLRKTEEGLI